MTKNCNARSAPTNCPDCGGALSIERDVKVDEPYFPKYPLRDAPLPRRTRIAYAAAFCGGCEFAVELSKQEVNAAVVETARDHERCPHCGVPNGPERKACNGCGAPRRAKNVRTRKQKVIAEQQQDGSYLLMTEDGDIDMAVSKAAALTIIKRRARSRNPGITLTTIEWRERQ